jgi:hypothetical protein
MINEGHACPSTGPARPHDFAETVQLRLTDITEQPTAVGIPCLRDKDVHSGG